MRKLKLLLCFLFFIFSFSFSFGQNWCWGRDGVVNLKANDEGSPIATNRFGSAYITGQFENVIIFGNDTLFDNRDNTYIVKYNSKGDVLWAKNPKTVGSNESFGHAIVSDGEDNAYITGFADSSMIFGTDTLYLPFSGRTGFFVKYNPSGQVLWAKSYDGVSLAINIKGNIYLVENNDSLYKFNPNGNVFSQVYLGGGGSINNVAIDSQGNIYAAGIIDTDSFSFSTIVPFIAKYDSNGNLLWSHNGSVPYVDNNIVSGNNGIGNSVITDRTGNVYMTGYFQDTLQFGRYTLISPYYPIDSTSSYALFLVKYNSNGKLLWAKQTVEKSRWRGTSLSKDKYDSIYMAGSGINDDTFSFGGKIFTLNPPGNASFIVKMDTSGKITKGSILRNGTFTYSPEDFNNGFAVDSSGQFCYLTGSFQGSTIICANDTLFDGAGQASYVAKWNVGECVYNTGDGIAPIATPNPSVLLYPNPSNGLFTISISHPELVSGTQTIQVYNMLGAKVYDGMLKQVQHDYEFNLFSQPNGVYLYRVITENGELVGEGKLIIQK